MLGKYSQSTPEFHEILIIWHDYVWFVEHTSMLEQRPMTAREALTALLCPEVWLFRTRCVKSWALWAISKAPRSQGDSEDCRRCTGHFRKHPAVNSPWIWGPNTGSCPIHSSALPPRPSPSAWSVTRYFEQPAPQPHSASHGQTHPLCSRKAWYVGWGASSWLECLPSWDTTEENHWPLSCPCLKVCTSVWAWCSLHVTPAHILTLHEHVAAQGWQNNALMYIIKTSLAINLNACLPPKWWNHEWNICVIPSKC